MEIAGRIVPATDSEPFTRESWMRVIEDRPDLIPAVPISGIPNPFRRAETMTVHPDPACASLFVNGVEVGSFYWARNDETMINVEGTITDVASVAYEIAEVLSGRFVPEK